MARSMAARFWSKVWKRANSLCWPWIGYIDAQGYARFWVDGTLGSVPAHRVAYIMFNPTVELGPDDKIMTCPILKACVNPEHLALAKEHDIGDRILWKKNLERK